MNYVLAAVFAVAAAAKLRDRGGLQVALEDFGLPRRLAPAVIAAEIMVAVCLVVPDLERAGAGGALAVLAAFSLVIARSLRAGRAVDCHCFGTVSAGSSAWGALLRNAVLAAAAVLVVSGFPVLGAPDVPSFAAGFGAAAALFLPLAFVALRRHGRVLTQLDGFARPAPALGAPSGAPALVLFSSEGCGACRALEPHLDTWRAKLNVVEREYADDPQAAEECGVRGTPAAVLLTADGRIARGPAHGLTEIEGLLA